MLAPGPATATPELELKFQLGEGALEALQAELFPLGQARTQPLHAIYFDTPAHGLRDGGFSLRVRNADGGWIQTLKHRNGGGLFQRDEWEVEVDGPCLDLARLVGTPAETAIAGAPLAAAFTVDVERRVHAWRRDESHIEVSFDTGVITAGDRHEPVAEMELELIAGVPQDLFGLARELQARAELTLSFESKAERGYRLAGHDGVAALKAQASAIGPKTRGAAAFQLIARDALVQIAGNARLLQRAHNPDVLHQLRVGLRRLRAALSVFKDMLDPQGLNLARLETRWLAGELSEARDLDVFLHRATTPDEIEESPGRAAFFRAVRHAQAEAYEKALSAVRSERFRSLLLALGEWIEVGEWQRLPDRRARRVREGSAAALAADVIDRLDRRLRRRSHGFRKLDADARHDLRKQAKKLRYAAAFFGETFPEHPKRRSRYITALRAVQDRLGLLNDMTVARDVAARLVGRRGGELAFAAGLEVGRLTRGEEVALDAADATFKAYRKLKIFWSAPAGHEDLNLSSSRLESV